MASVFISYSSRDRLAVLTVAEKLRFLGHDVWLDQWRIQIGHSISAEIERGLESSTFLVLMLSKHAVESGWVGREWRTAYISETETGGVSVLPALLEPCTIPPLLRDKKYAVLFPDLDSGVAQILQAIRHHDAERARGDFYAPADRLLAEERNLDDSVQRSRNEYWDEFDRRVDAQMPEVKRVYQEVNTLHYLKEYGLTIRQLKLALAELGVKPGEINDRYDDSVAFALETFQRRYNLRHVDGIFGPVTYLMMKQVANVK